MQPDFLNNPDRSILSLMKGIALKESNNNPTPGSTRITKTEGSVGRYQYLPDTFKERANKYFKGVNPLTGKPLDVNNDDDQKLVTYSYIKDKKDQGYKPQDIAASHNAGEGRINNWQGMVGINKAGNKYDVPDYVNKVMHLAQEANKQFKDPAYKIREYNPKIDSPQAKKKDQENLIKVQQAAAQQDAVDQAYQDRAPILGETLDPVTDALGNFTVGMRKGATRYAGNIVTNLNDKLDISDNPSFIPGTASNEFAVEGQNVAKGGFQKAGDVGFDVLKIGAEAIPATRLASAVGGGIMAGKLGNTAKNIYTSPILKGMPSLGLRAGVAGVAEAVPYAIDDALQGKEDTGDNFVRNAAIGAGLGIGGAALSRIFRGPILEQIAKAKTSGDIEKVSELMSSPTYQGMLRKAGINSAEDAANAVKAEIPTLRRNYEDLVGTTAGQRKIADMTDEAVQQVQAALSNPEIRDGKIYSLGAANKLLSSADEALENSKTLVTNISQSLKKAGQDIDLVAFKNDLISEIRNKIPTGEITTSEAKRFENFIDSNLNTKAPKGAFEKLHNLRRALNVKYGAEKYDESRYLADKIRTLVKNLPEGVPGVKEYKAINKAYGDAQDAAVVLTKINNKGVKADANTIGALAGVAAHFGGFAPVTSFGISMLSRKLASKAANSMTSKALRKGLLFEQPNPLEEAVNAVRNATKNTGENLSKIEATNLENALKIEATNLENALKMKKEITQENATAFVKKLATANTDKEVKEVTGLLKKLAQHPQAEKYKKWLEVKVDDIAEAKTLKDKEQAIKDAMTYTPDEKLPVIDFGKTPDSKVVRNMKATSKGLPGILGAIVALGGAGSMQTDASVVPNSVMNNEDNSMITSNQANRAAVADNSKGIHPIFATSTPDDIDNLKAVIFGEISNKPPETQKQEIENILSILQNRADYGKEWKNKNLTDLLSQKKQFDAWGKPLFNAYKNGTAQKNVLEQKKIKMIDEAVNNMLMGRHQNKIKGNPFYLHWADGSMHFYPTPEAQAKDFDKI